MYIQTDKIYVRIDNHWFDLSNYKDHPGGQNIFKKYHLKDATSIFNETRGHADTSVESRLRMYEIKNIMLLIFLRLILK